MRAPVKREQLKEKNALDAADERAAARERSPEQGANQVAELSDLVRTLAIATGAAADAPNDLEEKARLYVLPLLTVR